MFRFATSGESHGECLIAVVSGMPAGVPIDEAKMNHCGAGSKGMAAAAA